MRIPKNKITKPKLSKQFLKQCKGRADGIVLLYDKFPTRAPKISNTHGTVSKNPDPDKKKIVCVGCSYTHGDKRLKKSESYPSYLQSMVTEEYQVLNMGRSGYGLLPAIEWYKFFGAKLSPEIVVLQAPSFLRQPAPLLQPENICHHVVTFGAEQPLRDKVMSEKEYVKYIEQFLDYLINRYLSTARKFISYLFEQKTHVLCILFRGKDVPFKVKRKWCLLSFDKLETLYKEMKVDYITIDADQLIKEGHWLQYVKGVKSGGGHADSDGNNIMASQVFNAIQKWV